jgi:hypothetical protein
MGGKGGATMLNGMMEGPEDAQARYQRAGSEFKEINNAPGEQQPLPPEWLAGAFPSGSGRYGLPGAFALNDDLTRRDPFGNVYDGNTGKMIKEVHPLTGQAVGQPYARDSATSSGMEPFMPGYQAPSAPPAELNLTSQPAAEAAPAAAPAAAATSTDPALTAVPEAAPSATNSTGDLLGDSVRSPPAYWSNQSNKAKDSLKTTQT